MQNVFNICDFGAVSDGKTDCTKAIQQALDKAAAVKGTVEVPPGEFLCGELSLAPSVSLVGYAGWGYREYGGSILKINNKNAKCLINLTGSHAARVSGLQLLGNGCLGEKIDGIGVYWEDYSTRDNYGLFKEENALPEPTQEGFREDTFIIENCQIKNFSGDGIHLQNMFAFTVKDNMIMANKGNAIYLSGWDGWIFNNIIHTNHGAAIYGDDTSHFSSLTITGNRIEWNHGGGINAGLTGHLSINNNYFDRAYGPAISVRGGGEWRTSSVTVVGNIINRSGKERADFKNNEYLNSHIYLNEVDNFTINGNVFRTGKDDHGKGTVSPNYGIVLSNTKGCSIMGNAMQGGALIESIVEINGSAENQIIGNTK